MDEDQLVGYYCQYCKKNVKCKVFVSSLRVITKQSPHRVQVEIKACCPDCEAPIGYASAFCELY